VSSSQQPHSQHPDDVQTPGRQWGSDHLWRCPMITIAVLAVFFALLTFADVLPSPADAPGLVAPLH